ncbi:MAG: CBS domain-containing protein, partial [Cyanobacteriota bacterium]|nr:CBS domain-containing protein [Cyanobacteriota bacterium]
MVRQSNSLPIDSIRLEEILEPFPLVVKPDTLVGEVLAQMNQTIGDHYSIHVSNPNETASLLTPIPVSCALVQEANRFVGIFIPGKEDLKSKTVLSQTTIAEVMTQPVQVLYETEYQNIFTVLSKFSQSQIEHLPVLNAEDRLIGLITKHTLNQALNPIELYSRIETLEQQVQQLELKNPKFLEQRQAETELKTRAKQQEAIASVSQQALSLTQLDPLLDQAVSLVADTLEVPHSQVLELLPNESTFLLRKGIGLNTPFQDQILVSA